MMNYFEKNERRDEELLREFNNDVIWFKYLERPSISNYYYDLSGYTMDGRAVIIELKYRDAIFNESKRTVSSKTFQAEDLYIEDYRFLDMILDSMAYDVIPLYINFLSDSTVIIYNLKCLKHRPRRYTNITIKSEGYGLMQRTNRQGLSLDDAIIYQKVNGQWKRK